MPRIKPVESSVTIELDGTQLQARAGEPVAAALIANGELLFSRSPKFHRPRGPFCMSGGCAQCLMRVDGKPNVATCRTPVTAGMRLERQNAMPDAKVDLLRANDFVFRDWFNHHEFMAGWPIAEDILQKIARQLSGLGVLPEREAPAREPAAIEHHELVIVGAGAAGLAAARHLSERNVKYTLFERESEVGGRLVSAAEVGQPAPWNAPARLRAEVVGLFADDGKPFLAVVEAERLHLVFFERILLTLGGHSMLPTFPNNDLPGVMSGRAVASLIRRNGVLPGKRIACVGEVNEAKALAALIQGAGGEAIAVGEEIVRAHGLRTVNAATTKSGGKQSCDIIATCGALSPAFELARAGGAHVVWNAEHRCFVVETDATGKTGSDNVFVAGEMRGPMSSNVAVEQGLAAAKALAGSAS
jgi:sarcosine oxidase subunit alpha